MKKLTLLVNIGLVGLAIYLTNKHGFPADSIEEMLIFSLIWIAPLITIVHLISGQHAIVWVDLYFKRKAAEERKRIKELE